MLKLQNKLLLNRPKILHYPPDLLTDSLSNLKVSDLYEWSNLIFLTEPVDEHVLIEPLRPFQHLISQPQTAALLAPVYIHRPDLAIPALYPIKV